MNRSILSLFMFCTFLFPNLALGEEKDYQQGQMLLEEAVTHFANGEFDKSKQLLIQAQAVTQEPARLAKIHLFLGLNALIDKEQKKAESYFQSALAFDPKVDLDPYRFKPEFVDVFRTVRNKLQGEISVTSEEKGAIVFIDGQNRGPVPCRIALPIGTHQVEVRRSSGEVLYKKEVLLRPQERNQLAVAIHQNQGLKPVTTHETSVAKTSSGRFSRRWTWVALGGSIGFLGLAIGYSLAARSNHIDGCAIIDPQGNDNSCQLDLTQNLSPDDANRYEELRQSLDRNRLIANISWGVTGAMAITAAILFMVEGKAPTAMSKEINSSQLLLHFWTPPSAEAGLGLGLRY